MTAEAPRPLPRDVMGALLVLVTLTGALAAHVVPDHRLAAAFWPAAGVQVLVLSFTPRQRWPPTAAAVLVAVLAGDLLGGRHLGLALGHAVVETLGALAASVLLTHRGRRRPTLADVPDLVRLLGAALVSGGLVSAAGAVAGAYDGVHPLTTSLAAVLATHAAAVLVIVPLALATQHRWAGGRIELGVQLLLLAVVCVLALVPTSEAPVLTFAPVMVLAWAGVRFDLRVVVAELAVLALFVTTLTVHGGGPFAGLAQQHGVDEVGAAALSQAYLACVALLVLPLGIATQLNTSLLDRITADGRLFRRNFTESLVGMGFVGPDPDGADLVVVDLNDTALDVLGGGPGDQLVGRSLRELLLTDAEYDDVLPRLLAGTLEGWRTECPLSGPRAGRVVLQLSLLSEGGDAPVFAVQLLDVTSEYRTRRDLEVAEQLTATTLDTTACIIMVIDLAGVVVRVNAATSAITGYDEGDLLGRPIWESGVAPAGAADIETLMTWPDGSGTPVVQESDVVTRGGDVLRVVWNTSVVRSEDGEPRYAVLTGIDVTAERTTRGLVDHLMEASFTTALVGIDARGRISVVNSGLAHLLGYHRDELVGEPFHRLMKTSELLDRTGADTLTQAFATLVRGLGVDGESRPRDWTWMTKSGAERLVSMSLSVSQDAVARSGGYLCVARDVAETRKSQEMLIAALDKERTAVERLRALDQAKNQFVSTVSHELRTPVTSIVGYAEMMIDGTIVEPLPDQIPLLETIERNGQRLVSMINDLLMLGGLDSGTVQSRREPFDLTTIVAPVAASVRPLLLDRDLVLDIDQPAFPVSVLGDRVQLERVLTNLVTNSVKFTEDGGHIGVRLSVDDDRDQAVLEVSDTGIGIPADEQDDLFHRFFRSSTAQSRQIQGTGLGLSIAAEIIASHGGTIEVHSVHLQGSTFTVRIPLDASRPELAGVGSGPVPAHPART